MPRGLGVALVLLAGISSGGYAAVKGGHVDEAVTQFRDIRDAAASAIGFHIASVALSGQKEVSRESILAGAGVTGKSSLLFLDASAAREKLKANPWIADATILKLYPDRLNIAVTERQAFALWQQDGRVSVIASDGVVVETIVDERFARLPLVVGKGAATKAADFLAVADRFPEIRDQVRAYIYVAERRWNLRLKNGMDIRLPEADAARALETLVTLDREKKLLSRDITVVDLRLPDRVTIRLSDAAAQAREEALKEKKKRKAGNA